MATMMGPALIASGEVEKPGYRATNQARSEAQRFYERLGFNASHVGMKLYL